VKGLPQARLLWPIRKNLGAPNRADAAAAIAKPSVQILPGREAAKRDCAISRSIGLAPTAGERERVSQREWKGWFFAHAERRQQS